jgi:hypothetical protein
MSNDSGKRAPSEGPQPKPPPTTQPDRKMGDRFPPPRPGDPPPLPHDFGQKDAKPTKDR